MLLYSQGWTSSLVPLPTPTFAQYLSSWNQHKHKQAISSCSCVLGDNKSMWYNQTLNTTEVGDNNMVLLLFLDLNLQQPTVKLDKHLGYMMQFCRHPRSLGPRLSLIACSRSIGNTFQQTVLFQQLALGNLIVCLIQYFFFFLLWKFPFWNLRNLGHIQLRKSQGYKKTNKPGDTCFWGDFGVFFFVFWIQAPFNSLSRYLFIYYSYSFKHWIY